MVSRTTGTVIQRSRTTSVVRGHSGRIRARRCLSPVMRLTIRCAP